MPKIIQMLKIIQSINQWFSYVKNISKHLNQENLSIKLLLTDAQIPYIDTDYSYYEQYLSGHNSDEVGYGCVRVNFGNIHTSIVNFLPLEKYKDEVNVKIGFDTIQEEVDKDINGVYVPLAYRLQYHFPEEWKNCLYIILKICTSDGNKQTRSYSQ